MDLFNQKPALKSASLKNVPLAERVRPRSLKEFTGHRDLIGEHTVLYREIRQNQVKSFILWGPPGVGKTTLAKIIANEVDADFISISAVTSGVSDIRKVIDHATKNRKMLNKTTILFIDEIHRFNKAQQDALLHAVEDGTIILIGATTENPSFEVISPLLSRCPVYRMKPLSDKEIRHIIERALGTDPQLSKLNIEVQDWDVLLKLSDGDARRGLNILEKSIAFWGDRKKPVILNRDIFQQVVQRKVLYYDKSGDYHYDLISAFIKSVRGSDPDAAIYWMARILEGGEDPKFIARRMIILASEDIGNADPYALTLATNCFTAVTYIGMPECRIILSQAAAYLAAAPKSNAAYQAISKAQQDVQNQPDEPVPLHLRNAPTRMMSEMGYGKNYQYAHDFQEHFVKEYYLPDSLKKRIYYNPSSEGKEAGIRERLKKLWSGMKQYPEHKEKNGKRNK